MRQLDFTAAEVISNPFPVLRYLLRADPVHWNEAIKSWCLTRYADVTGASQDLRFSSARIRPSLARRRSSQSLDTLADGIGLWMVFNDPPAHTRLRKLTQKAFARRGVETMRDTIEVLVNELIDRVVTCGQMDFVRDFAYPLPANIIADMLGVPRENIEDLKRWSDDLAQFVLSSRINPQRHELAAQSLQRMNELFADLIAQRRRRPGNGLMDLLIAACDDDEGLNEHELLAFCVLLLFAGHETTTHFFANGLRALLLHPSQMALLRKHLEDPRLVTNALHEMMRWDGPIIAVSRYLKEDLQWGDKTMRAGQRVYLFNAAANRDPAVFEQPDRFDIRRPQADKMIGFGYGIHLCLGIHLARLEAQIAFPILLKRLPEIRLLSDELEWTDTLVMRGPKTLPLAFEP